ncbi:MAG: T9SS type A sorting domain-containing protein [Bacteroidales bacterium]|jgi:hypothetical protein|nr:T9SS type A sorting domain-containing protein [Bacteroidales bacterium]
MRTIITILALAIVFGENLIAQNLESVNGVRAVSQQKEQTVNQMYNDVLMKNINHEDLEALVRQKERIRQVYERKSSRNAQELKQNAPKLSTEVFTLPFIEDFDDAGFYAEHWTVIDANEDFESWEYAPLTGCDGLPGYVSIYPIFAADVTDDYLVSSAIEFSSKGAYYLTFYVKPTSVQGESFSVLYGTSPNVEKMELLVDYPDFTAPSWAINICDFELEESGVYYFAFHCYSSGIILDLDKITIDAGSFYGVPDISFKRPLVSASSCDLSSEEIIGAELYNDGSKSLNEFTLTYQVNDNPPVSETFNTTIGIRETVRVYFEETADLSALSDYTISLTASTPEEENTDDNTTEIIRSHFSPITELPFISDFSNVEDAANWSPSTPNGWEHREDHYYAVDNNTALLSRCITLSAGKYYFSHTYYAGFMTDDCDFYIAYGESGTDPFSWTPTKEYLNIITSEETTDEIIIDIAEAGNYVFTFIGTKRHFLHIFNASLIALPEHELRINGIASPFVRMTPHYQVNNENAYTLTVENRGLNAETGNIDVILDNEVVASKAFNITNIGEIKSVDIPVKLENFKVGDKVELKFDLSIESLGQVVDSYNIQTIVSDSAFIIDAIENNFPDGVGAETPISFGFIYEIGRTDTLTSMNVGLYNSNTSKQIGFAVYPVNDNNQIVGAALFEVEHTRPVGGSSINFDLPDTELTPGKYFFELQQLDNIHLAIAYDEDPEGYILINKSDNLKPEKGFGYIHLRPNFGKNTITGISEESITDQLRIYPNPTRNLLRIEKELEIKSIKIFDMTGRLFHELHNIGTTETVIDLSSFADGIYFLNVDGKVIKMIKQ